MNAAAAQASAPAGAGGDSSARAMARLLHEIDTPLGVALTAVTVQEPALQAFAQRVELLPRDPELMALMHRIEQSARLVRSALERAIAVTASHRRKRRNEAAASEALDLGTILADALEVPLARYGDRVVECRLDAEAGLLVHSEPNAWYQVITNLVANSVLHGFVGRAEGGTIEVSASRTESDRVRVVYRDDGCGMSAHARSAAFVRSYTSRHGAGSSGLGLGIVAELVRERLHGRIELLPEGPQRGCACAIEIPVRPSHPTADVD